MSSAIELRLDAVSRSFGSLKAVQDVSLHMPAGGTYGLIGPNGAGKTTLFNLISGVLVPSAGSVTVDGEEVAGKGPEQFARRGVLRTFQNTSVFDRLSALDNLLVGAYLTDQRTGLRALVAPRRYGRASRELLDRAESRLELVGMSARRDVLAKSLSYGELRYLEIAVALMNGPRLLLLDEPAAGLNEGEVARLERILDVLREDHAMTILLVEHNVGLVTRACERIWVLNRGQLVMDGTPDEVVADARVREVYLGV
jgi:ABC-type branched-subunit amino acid transport system ATPase component